MEYPKNPSIEIVEDYIVSDKVTDKENDEDPFFQEIIQDSEDEQDEEDPIDLNILPDNGLIDLNKFPDEEDETSDEAERKEEWKKLRKIYLSKFY